MTDLLLWSLFWPFIIIVPLALMALFKYFNPRSFEILMYFLHRLKSEQSADCSLFNRWRKYIKISNDLGLKYLNKAIRARGTMMMKGQNKDHRSRSVI